MTIPDSKERRPPIRPAARAHGDAHDCHRARKLGRSCRTLLAPAEDPCPESAPVFRRRRLDSGIDEVAHVSVLSIA